MIETRNAGAHHAGVAGEWLTEVEEDVVPGACMEAVQREMVQPGDVERETAEEEEDTITPAG